MPFGVSVRSQHDFSLNRGCFQTAKQGNLNVALYAFKALGVCFNYKAQIALRLQYSFTNTFIWSKRDV